MSTPGGAGPQPYRPMPYRPAPGAATRLPTRRGPAHRAHRDLLNNVAIVAGTLVFVLLVGALGYWLVHASLSG